MDKLIRMMHGGILNFLDTPVAFTYSNAMFLPREFSF